MRKIALFTALLAILASSTASAKNDFDALLGELDFGGPTKTEIQSLTLNNIAARNLAPAPHAQVSAQAPITDPGAAAGPESITMPVPEPDLAADPNIIPEQYPPAEPSAAAELGAPVATDGCSVQPQCGCSPRPQCNNCCSNRSSCGRHQCNLLDKLPRGTCVTYTPPNLPTSSFYQYFKSNSCNCRVWDGYQNKCVLCSKHSRGECNCFAPCKTSCLSGLSCGSHGRGVCRASSPSCHSGACQSDGCHELPECWSQGDCAGEATCAAPAVCDASGCDG